MSRKARILAKRLAKVKPGGLLRVTAKGRNGVYLYLHVDHVKVTPAGIIITVSFYRKKDRYPNRLLELFAPHYACRYWPYRGERITGPRWYPPIGIAKIKYISPH